MAYKKKVDYTLYLVTDSTMLPPGTTLRSQVLAGLENGVTLVQLREKETETATFVKEALEIKEICAQFDVPLIINDRVDVAMAIDADGVHVGQSDMPIPMVRKLLGPDKIIGWSVGHVHEVEALSAWGPEYVDYIGIGMVFPTNTKKNPKKSPMGPQGVIRILDALENNDASWCRTICIGGLHPVNIPRVLYQCSSTNGKRSVDGISVVSDIMASSEAGRATKNLRELLAVEGYHFIPGTLSSNSEITTDEMAQFIKATEHKSPLVQHITNKVHQNFGANITLALGSSPIMSEVVSEFRELSQIPNATLLMNTGSVAPLEALVDAISAYNESRRPIVFDPVGYSATEARLNLNNHLLTYGQFACIKGNEGEILSMAQLNTGKMKGVDSGAHGASFSSIVQATRIVAFKYRTIAVCTGKTDVIVDGTLNGKFSLSSGAGLTAEELPCYTVDNGDMPIMGRITASGCSLGSTIACMVGGVADQACVFHAVVTAVALYKSAGKQASSRCKGSGSFQVELIDALYQLFTDNNPSKWTAEVKRI